jgi:hypothetical protein
MDTNKLEQLLSSLGTDAPIKTLSHVQELSSDGSFRALFTKDTVVISFDSKVYLFPIEEGETADEVVKSVAYMFISGDPAIPEEIVELRENLKTVEEPELFLAVQFSEGFFIGSKSVTTDNIAKLKDAMAASHASKTIH